MAAETVRIGDGRRRAALDAAIPDPAIGDGGSSFRFLCGDGVAFLKGYRFDGSELVYCDPPYVRSTRTGRDLYRFEMTDLQHRRLLRVIQNLPCMVMISGYWSDLYADALKSWKRVSFQAMTRRGPRTEWLWFNFEQPAALHDYRYLGRDFRERERIKRRTERWVARLERMPGLERRALLARLDGDGDARSRIGESGDGGSRKA